MNIRRPNNERGFALVELVVVMLVLALLIAIAIPVFLGARKRADDRAAQSKARDALVAAKTIFQVDEDYSAATVTALSATEKSITFVDANTASTTAIEVSVDTPSSLILVLAVYSKTGTCFFLKDEAVALSGGTTYASLDTASSNCKAGSPPADPAFTSNW